MRGPALEWRVSTTRTNQSEEPLNDDRAIDLIEERGLSWGYIETSNEARGLASRIRSAVVKLL